VHREIRERCSLFSYSRHNFVSFWLYFSFVINLLMKYKVACINSKIRTRNSRKKS
jgi:hypothetical protein